MTFGGVGNVVLTVQHDDEFSIPASLVALIALLGAGAADPSWVHPGA